MSPRVAIATQDWPSFTDGGVGTLAAVLAAGLQAEGAEVEVWTRGGGARARAIRRDPGFGRVRALRGRSWRRRGPVLWERGGRRALADFAPDVLVAMTWDPLPGLLAACRQVPSPPQIHCFAFGRDITGRLEEPEREAARRGVLRAPIGWLVLTRWLGPELSARGVSPERIRVVPAAVVPPSVPTRRPDGEPSTLLTVGRLVPRKGQDRTIEALARLSSSRPALRYILAGDGPDRARLEALARELGVQGRVEFRGSLRGEALEAAWAEADLMVMVPRVEPGGDTEGYGLVYLEAGARGVPVLGARSAGAEEAVAEARTGRLLSEGARADEIAAAIADLFEDRAALDALGAGGRAAYERGGRPEHLARAVLALASDGRGRA